MEFTSCSWQETRRNKPGLRLGRQREGMRGCWATAGEELKQVCHLGDVLWEGQRHSTLYPPQNTPGSSSYLSGAVAWACQADLGSKFFCLSDVNFTCLVIVLIFILPSPPPPRPALPAFGTDHLFTTCISRRFPCDYCGRQ